jgi:hypothetical protein
MGDVVDMPGGVTMRFATEVGDGVWSLTENVLNDPLQYCRLVRSQTEELLALYQQYPLPEFESVRQILAQMQRAYSDVAPFDHPLLAAMHDDDDDDDEDAA